MGECSVVQCFLFEVLVFVGEGLIVCGEYGDGLIDGVEFTSDNFVVAVVWHPEERLDDLRLFAAVVQAAAAYATGRVGA